MQLLHDRRWCDRVSVQGAAAVLEFGHLGITYELTDISIGGARLKGGRALPRTQFSVLLSVCGRFLECRARPVWDDREHSDSLGIEFENLESSVWFFWPQEEDNEKSSLGAM